MKFEGQEKRGKNDIVTIHVPVKLVIFNIHISSFFHFLLLNASS